jgi:hypothetical protein
MRPFAVVLALLLVATLPACGGAEDAWLRGTWTLAFNPQRDSADVLEFDGRGRITIRTSDGQSLRGRYHVSGDLLTIALEKDDRSIEVDFSVSPDRKRLMYHTGAYYEREE